jgi:hypothetical protein
MGQSKRIRRGTAGWRKLFSRQSGSGLSVPEFCRREGINGSLFRRWGNEAMGQEHAADETTARGRHALWLESRVVASRTRTLRNIN